MKFGQRQITIAAGTLLVCIVGVVAWVWRPANNTNFPEGTWWACTNKSCGNTFNLSMQQLSDHNEKNYGQAIKCPKCGTDAVRADLCPHCKQVSASVRGSFKCPKCGKDLFAPPQ